MKGIYKIIAAWLLIAALLFNTVSCDLLSGNTGGDSDNTDVNESFYIDSALTLEMTVGETLSLNLINTVNTNESVVWTSSSDCATVEDGVVSANKAGSAIIKASLGELSDQIIITIKNVDTPDNGGNTDSENQPGDKPEDKPEDKPFGSGYDSITVMEAQLIAEECTSSSSKEKYYIIASILYMLDSVDGEMEIADDTGMIYVYKSVLESGIKFSEAGIGEGYQILIYGTLRNYKGLLEIDNGTIIDYLGPNGERPGNTGGDSDDPIIPPPDNADDPIQSDPYVGVNERDFYAYYTPAISYNDAYYRTKHNLMSGSIEEQDQKPTISKYQPTSGGKYIRNTDYIFSADGKTYYVVDAYGNIVMEIYYGGAYVVLEEVAAYVFAFGEPPANHSASKKTTPKQSAWGIYLRVNNTEFSGDTYKYPYEPELPRISGCGGDLTYYEMDIGTTGTDCDPSYESADYNDGTTITRGAARIVYSAYDRNGNKIIDLDERYVFYTYNHYNDFQEYLNYLGGWGEMFGNVTGGGTISSKYNYNPTPYVAVVRASLSGASATVVYYYVPKNEYVA